MEACWSEKMIPKTTRGVFAAGRSHIVVLLAVMSQTRCLAALKEEPRPNIIGSTSITARHVSGQTNQQGLAVNLNGSDDNPR
jgi:hypothetical protein